MIHYMLNGHNFVYEVQTTIQIFYPNTRYTQMETVLDVGIFIVSSIITENEPMSFSAVESSFFCDGKRRGRHIMPLENQSGAKAIIKKSLYTLLKQVTGHKPPWGSLTGIRPSKIVHALYEKGATDNFIFEYFENTFDVNRDKIQLVLDVAKAEQPFLLDKGETFCQDAGGGTAFLKEEEHFVSLYVAIPFCVSRCSYCSFPSHPYTKEKSGLYLQALNKEIDFIKNNIQNKKIQSVYIGGGTPTSLDNSDFEALLQNISPLSRNAAEFTVEAGRPDTINQEKLIAMKQLLVNRISINPQTMNDETLAAIGRSHTASDIERVYDLARVAGHDNINMDIILGLSGENASHVENTMKKLGELGPENITVHTLSVKRASKLKENFEGCELVSSEEIEKMLKIAYGYTKAMGLHPYYIYRQKNMAGNFENVGYAKVNKECIFNIQTMAEKQSVIAIGAGAITKIVDTKTGQIRRIFNVKDVDAYINRIDEMIARKAAMLME